MRKLTISATITKSAVALFTAFIILYFNTCTPALGQQWVIANKDNTRPEVTAQAARPPFVTALTIQRGNGNNDISWTAMREEETRKYIIEYSVNGIDYLTAGEVVSGAGNYSYKHHTLDQSPMLYRIKMELLNSRAFYSNAVVLDGTERGPVNIYPTIIQGNTVNVNASWPIEKITVVSENGQQVYSNDVNGQKDYIAIVVPSLGKGIYWMAFYGNGWKTTQKFIIQ